VVPWPVALAAGAALIIAARWPRRALALALTLILGVLAFESGVHSVHHIGDAQSGATCSVATATAQIAGTPGDDVSPAPPILPSEKRVALQQRPNLEAFSLAVHQGRAPPRTA
jgi:hypothetical protein